ncbi:MAG: hypothetical protein Q7V05_00405 [Methanoregula sp.]|nr:hypothetical protein [Methanoregula sp.]
MKKNEDEISEAARWEFNQPGIIPGICPVAEKRCIATMNTEVLESSCVRTIPGGI